VIYAPEQCLEFRQGGEWKTAKVVAFDKGAQAHKLRFEDGTTSNSEYEYVQNLALKQRFAAPVSQSYFIGQRLQLDDEQVYGTITSFSLGIGIDEATLEQTTDWIIKHMPGSLGKEHECTVASGDITTEGQLYFYNKRSKKWTLQTMVLVLPITAESPLRVLGDTCFELTSLKSVDFAPGPAVGATTRMEFQFIVVGDDSISFCSI
jgi:hypothetical protein